jgi:uncharacterized protein
LALEGNFMTRWLTAFFLLAAACVQAGDDSLSKSGAGIPCTASWYQFIEKTVATGDGQGHGPDIGSEEWKSVIEFRLGIRGAPDLPARDSEDWCRLIDRIVREKFPDSSTAHGARQGSSMTNGPSYDCGRVEAGGIEDMICKDIELSALDRQLSGVYAAAARKSTDEYPPVLKAEQRGWIKGRNECWKAGDKRACVQDAYRNRIAELEARYRLVDGRGPFRFVCDDIPANEVIVTYFRTDPPTLIAERGDSVSLMYLQPSASGTKYQGRNETFWEHGGEASITWGYGTSPMRCRKAP